MLTSDPLIRALIKFLVPLLRLLFSSRYLRTITILLGIGALFLVLSFISAIPASLLGPPVAASLFGSFANWASGILGNLGTEIIAFAVFAVALRSVFEAIEPEVPDTTELRVATRDAALITLSNALSMHGISIAFDTKSKEETTDE